MCFLNHPVWKKHKKQNNYIFSSFREFGEMNTSLKRTNARTNKMFKFTLTFQNTNAAYTIQLCILVISNWTNSYNHRYPQTNSLTKNLIIQLKVMTQPLVGNSWWISRGDIKHLFRYFMKRQQALSFLTINRLLNYIMWIYKCLKLYGLTIYTAKFSKSSISVIRLRLCKTSGHNNFRTQWILHRFRIWNTHNFWARKWNIMEQKGRIS